MNSLPYIAVFLSFIALGLIESRAPTRKIKRVAIITSIVVYSLFFGLRGFILTDFANYYPAFNSIHDDSANPDAYSYSTAFFWLVYCAKTLLGSYSAYIFASAVIHAAIFSAIAWRIVGNIGLSLAFFMVFRGIVYEINLMQNYVSILFFLWSLSYVQSRRPSRFLVANALGSAVHPPSVIYLLSYLPLRYHFNRLVYVSLCLAAGVYWVTGQNLLISFLRSLANVLGPSFVEFLNIYTDREAIYLSVAGNLERIAILFLILVFYKKIKTKFEMFEVVFVLYIIYALSYFLLWNIEAIASRVSLLFVCSTWFVVPMVILSFRGSEKALLIILFACLGVVKIYVATVDEVAEYRTVFSGESYLEAAEKVRVHNEGRP